MNEKKRLIKNTGLIAIGNLSTRIVQFLLLPLYTAILTTQEYGIVDYIISISTFCVPFISVLMDESMFRFLIDCKTDQERAKVISASMVIILFGGTAFLLVAIPVLIVIQYSYSLYVVLYVLSSVLSTMMSALLRGTGRTDRYVVYNFSMSLAKILLNVLFIAVIRLGVVGMLSAAIVSQFSLPTLYFIWLKLWNYISLKNLEKKRAVEMIRYSFPLIPNKISWSIINLSDRIIIMNVIGSSASGLYAISYKFPTLLDTVYGFFYQSWKESSARALGDGSPDEFYNMIYEYIKNFMYSLVVGMTAFMPAVFSILINKNFHNAIYYVPILLLGTYFSNISGFYGGIFSAYKDTKIMGTTTVAAAVINIIVNLLMIQTFGLYAAAISTLIANVVVYIYRKYKIRKYIKLKENRLKQGIALLVTFLVFGLFYTQQIIWMTFGCGISILYALYANWSLLQIIYRIWHRRKI